MKLLYLSILSIIAHIEAYQSATQQHYSLYLSAQYSQQQNRADRAQEYYAQLYKLKAPIFTYAGYFEHLITLGNLSAILHLIPETKGYFDTNKDVQIIIGQALELAGKKHDAEETFIKLYEHYKQQPDVAYYAAAAHARRNQFMQALTIINEYMSNTLEQPNHFMFYFLKSKIYQLLNNEKDALENLKKGLDLYKSIQGSVQLPINKELPLVSQLINESYAIFNKTLHQTKPHHHHRKLNDLWQKMHS